MLQPFGKRIIYSVYEFLHIEEDWLHIRDTSIRSVKILTSRYQNWNKHHVLTETSTAYGDTDIS